MKRYLKLLNWEINRFGKLYAVLWLVTLLSQVIGVVLFANQYMNRANEEMYRNYLTAAEFTARSKTGFDHYIGTFFFEAPIALCIVALLLYTFLIWYREWFGKNTFAYRLLMLPTSRMNVYLAKLSAILLYVLGLAAFQLLILPPQILIFNSIVPSEFRGPVSFSDLFLNNSLLHVLFPRHFIDFVLYYSAGLMGVIIIFTAILLERSYRLKGIVAGILYAVAAGFLFLSPFLITQRRFSNTFYQGEVFWMEVVAGLLIIGVSLWFSSFLLRKKVTV